MLYFSTWPRFKGNSQASDRYHYRFNFKLCFWILVKELPLGRVRYETFKMAHIWDWWRNIDNYFIEGHLLRVPDTDDVKQKKNHETIPSSSLVPRCSLLIRCPREVWERAGERTAFSASISRDVTAHSRVQEWPSRKRLGTRLTKQIFPWAENKEVFWPIVDHRAWTCSDIKLN